MSRLSVRLLRKSARRLMSLVGDFHATTFCSRPAIPIRFFPFVSDYANLFHENPGVNEILNPMRDSALLRGLAL